MVIKKERKKKLTVIVILILETTENQETLNAKKLIKRGKAQVAPS